MSPTTSEGTCRPLTTTGPGTTGSTGSLAEQEQVGLAGLPMHSGRQSTRTPPGTRTASAAGMEWGRTESPTGRISRTSGGRALVDTTSGGGGIGATRTTSSTPPDGEEGGVMNRTQRIALISPLIVALLGGAVFGLVRAGSSAFGCGAEPVVGVAGIDSAVAEGRGIAAVAGDQIVMLEGAGNRSVYSLANVGNGVIRHVASALGVGSAYVNDKKGPDTLFAVSTQGVSEISASGEVTHPALSASGDIAWAEDFHGLKLSSPIRQSAKTIARPQGSTAVFSPIFTGPNELIAVIQEPVVGYTGEDDSLNNLFRYDISSDTWSRLTAFQATAENWSVLRTPVLARDGRVFFVRLRGVASETRPPSFELWSLRGETVSKVRDLPKEMFLAGINDQGLLWNIYDGREWRLFLESETGLLDLGCGAVMVDPRAQPDPDIPKEDPALG